MKKVLITGGAGFIGSAIVPELKRAGFDPFILDNLSFGNRNFVDVDDAHFFLSDIRNEGEVLSVIEKVSPEIVIHLAAVHFIPYCNQHPYESADINISGTINLLNAVRKCKTVKRFFFASTAAVYPIADLAVNESHQLKPLDIYGLSKLTGEHLCNEFHLETGISTIVCRFFNAFGPNETNAHLIPEIERQLKSGKRTIDLGNLDPKRDFIHTYDMARAVRMLVMNESIKYDTFNLGRGIEYSVREVVNAFEKEIGEKIQINVDATRVRKVERMHLLADISRLKSAINWEPEWSLEKGISSLMQSNG